MNNKLVATASTVFGLAVVAIIFLFLWGCPNYKVYQQRLLGKAELERATYNRKVAEQEAVAKKSAAKDLAAADTIRAHGVARSNQIIGQSLKTNHEYLHWLWIEQLEKANVVYVPTEANLPIIEAGRLGTPSKITK